LALEKLAGDTMQKYSRSSSHSQSAPPLSLQATLAFIVSAFSDEREAAGPQD
jgi:hypothetical protein